jgi:MFS family permease
VQAAAPRLLGRHSTQPDGRTAMWLALALTAAPAGIATALEADIDPTLVVIAGLALFGVVFALNSAVHSYLILSYAESGRAAMNVGFYYMANAGGRLAGTVLSGALYEWRGLAACLWASVAFVLAAGAISPLLPAARAASPGAVAADVSFPA